MTTSILLLFISHTVTCRPNTVNTSTKVQAIGFQKADNFENEEAKIQNCYKDMDLNELCERCEKISQSKPGDVFAMCCSNEDNATEYCRNYVYYGVTKEGER
jgi:hypothetical protein